jgi:hypothetical protein
MCRAQHPDGGFVSTTAMTAARRFHFGSERLPHGRFAFFFLSRFPSLPLFFFPLSSARSRNARAKKKKSAIAHFFPKGAEARVRVTRVRN